MSSSSTVPKGSYDLIYFDIPALGETVRLTMYLAGITFEDTRLSGADFKETYKEKTPYGQMPVLTFPDGKTRVAQQRAITRYFGKFAVVDGGKKLYPDNAMDALFVDEMNDAVWDIQGRMAKTFSMSGEERKAARENLFNKDKGGFCYEITKKVDERIAAHGKTYSVSDYLTLADISLFTWMNTLRCGVLDHIPKDYLSGFPEIAKRVKAIGKHPLVAKYYTQDKMAKHPKGHYACFQPGVL